MIPRIEIATALIPGGGKLRLMRRGAEFSIMLDGNELMNSRLSGSEEALATLTIDRLGAIDQPHLLIGGLGMGFTLRAALGRLGPAARVTVAELVPAVIEWARGPLNDTFGGCLQDARVDIVEADVGDVIGSARATYDAILLDVAHGMRTSRPAALLGCNAAKPRHVTAACPQLLLRTISPHKVLEPVS